MAMPAISAAHCIGAGAFVYGHDVHSGNVSDSVENGTCGPEAEA